MKSKTEMKYKKKETKAKTAIIILLQTQFQSTQFFCMKLEFCSPFCHATRKFSSPLQENFKIITASMQYSAPCCTAHIIICTLIVRCVVHKALL